MAENKFYVKDYYSSGDLALIGTPGSPRMRGLLTM